MSTARLAPLRNAIGIIALLCAAPSTAQSLTSQQIAAIDAAASKTLAETGVPAASIAITRDGQIVYAKAYGLQRAGQPASEDAKYPIGSVSKQFTAAAILILADEGKLNLDDPVGKYLPALTRGNDVTIRQLLAHTAGYRDYWPQEYGFSDTLSPIEPNAILQRWATKPLDFEPGTRRQYSNTGYVAAGLIVEKVSGQSLNAFLRDRIFSRLGMNPIDIGTDLTAKDPVGYERNVLGPVRVARPSARGWYFGAGQLGMTAMDLSRWDGSVIARSVMSPAAYEAQQRTTVLKNGVATGYGLGMYVKDDNGHRLLEHQGGVTGFRSENRIFPDDRAAIVVLVNADFNNAQVAIADAIEQQLFSDDSGVDRLRTVFGMLRAGRIDRAQFTSNGNEHYTAQVLADWQASLTQLGEPKGVEQTRSFLRGGLVNRHFTIAFANRSVEATLLTEPGSRARVEELVLVVPGN